MTATTVLSPARATERAQIRNVPLLVLLGALAGLAYGIVIRGWMRFISDEPEFSWSGTIFVVLAFTILGVMAGLVLAGRRRGWKATLVLARTAGLVLGLACFAGAGMIMLPTMLFGGLALARSDWPRWLRGVLGALAFVSTLPVLVDAGPSGLKLVAAGVMYLALCSVEVLFFVELMAPSVHRLPRAGLAVAFGAVALLLLPVVLTTGSVFAAVVVVVLAVLAGTLLLRHRRPHPALA